MNYPWGNIVGHWPRWTPYAAAIAEEYAIVVPWFMTVPTSLTGSTREQRSVTTPPYLYDVLIFGAHIDMGSDSNGDNGQLMFLQVADRRTGIPWVSAAPVNSAPATAFGGSRFQPSPILQLPEAFFLPKGVELQHDWSVFSTTATGGTITWVGVQLIQPRNGQAPDFVTMPDGSVIKVGSRLPWLSCIGLGTEISVLGAPFYAIADGSRYRHFSSPDECAIEVHDVHANYFTQDDVSSSPELIRLGFADRGQKEFWTLNLAGSPAVAGDVTKVYTAAPFTKPYKLKSGNRMQVSLLNLTGNVINNAFLTLRGVRLCEY